MKILSDSLSASNEEDYDTINKQIKVVLLN